MRDYEDIREITIDGGIYSFWWYNPETRDNGKTYSGHAHVTCKDTGESFLIPFFVDTRKQNMSECYSEIVKGIKEYVAEQKTGNNEGE